MSVPLPHKADELEALEDLLKSDGFRLMERYAVNEIKGDGYVARMKKALESGDIMEAKATDKALAITAAIFEYPRRRLAELKRKIA